MSKKFYFSRRGASGGGKDLSCGYESGDILAGDSDADVYNQYSVESEGIMCESGEADESSGEDSESSSEPEMDFSHKNKKSRVSASDEITPSRSVLPQGRGRVLAAKSGPTHKRKQSHRSLSCRARASNLSPSDQRQSNEVAAALSEITNMLTKVVARLDTQEKILKVTISASSSSSCS